MNIYLIRHGKAESGSVFKPDSERELLANGKDEMMIAASHWKRAIKQFDYIVSSPYTRALQTAEIIKEIFNHNEDIIIEPFLATGGNVSKLVTLCNSLSPHKIAFVGHEPTFSRYVSQLVSSVGISINFRKGMIAKISFVNKVREGGGTLEYLIPTVFFK